jgi:uncharacterized UPF0160 family protein
VRTRDPEIIATGDIVFDIGRKYDGEKFFDHHQEGGAGVRESGIPYASFGLVWNKFANNFCTEEEKDRLDKSIVSFVDAGDNGVDLFVSKTVVPNVSVIDVVCSFNLDTKDADLQHRAFMEAVSFAKKILELRLIEAKNFFVKSKEVKEAYINAEDKRIVVLDGHIDKMIIHENLAPTDAIFAIHEYNGGWAVRSVRKNLNDFESKKNLPESWAGKIDLDLQKVTGVEDALFCHNGRFITKAKSKEGAIALAKLALEN